MAIMMTNMMMMTTMVKDTDMAAKVIMMMMMMTTMVADTEDTVEAMVMVTTKAMVDMADMVTDMVTDMEDTTEDMVMEKGIQGIEEDTEAMETNMMINNELLTYKTAIV